MQKKLLMQGKCVGLSPLLVAAWSLFHVGVPICTLSQQCTYFYYSLFFNSGWKNQQTSSDLKNDNNQKKLPKEPAQPQFSSCLILEIWRGFFLSWMSFQSAAALENYSKCCSYAAYEKMPRNKEILILLPTAGG